MLYHPHVSPMECFYYLKKGKIITEISAKFVQPEKDTKK